MSIRRENFDTFGIFWAEKFISFNFLNTPLSIHHMHGRLPINCHTVHLLNFLISIFKNFKNFQKNFKKISKGKKEKNRVPLATKTVSLIYLDPSLLDFLLNNSSLGHFVFFNFSRKYINSYTW